MARLLNKDFIKMQAQKNNFPSGGFYEPNNYKGEFSINGRRLHQLRHKQLMNKKKQESESLTPLQIIFIILLFLLIL